MSPSTSPGGTEGDSPPCEQRRCLLPTEGWEACRGAALSSQTFPEPGTVGCEKLQGLRGRGLDV